MAERLFATAPDGARIHYELRGTGTPLVMIMGFGAAIPLWGEFVLAPLARRHRLILIDNRGTGYSDKPDKAVTLAELAADAASVLDDARIERAHVMGVSMGGMIAQEFALNFSARTRGLILGCTNCGGPHTIQPPAPPPAQFVIFQPSTTHAEQVRAILQACCTEEFWNAPANRARIEEMEAAGLAWPRTPLYTMTRHLDAIQRFDTFDRLGRIKAPTSIIAGDADAIVPAENSRILGAEIKGAKVKIFKGVGHGFHLERPEETVREVLEHLADAERA